MRFELYTEQHFFLFVQNASMNVSLSVGISFDLAVYCKHCLHYCQPIAEFFALGPSVTFLVTQLDILVDWVKMIR